MLRVRGEQALQSGRTVTRGVPNSARLNTGQPGDPTTRDAGIQDALADSYYLLVEKFDNFKEVKLDGSAGGETKTLILPHSYSLEYSVEGQGSTFLAHWNMSAEQWVHNVKMDPSVFKAH